MAWDPLPASLLFRDSHTERLARYYKGDARIGDEGVIGEIGSDDHPWHYLVLANDMCLHKPETVDWIKTLSLQAPLFCYVRTDDYGCTDWDRGVQDPQKGEVDENEESLDGWGYRLFHLGEEIACAGLSYQWPTWGEALHQELSIGLKEAYPDRFSLFGLPAETLVALQELLDPDKLYQRLEDEAVGLEEIGDEFQKLLDIHHYHFSQSDIH